MTLDETIGHLDSAIQKGVALESSKEDFEQIKMWLEELKAIKEDNKRKPPFKGDYGEMTVGKLHEELEKLLPSHRDTRVIVRAYSDYKFCANEKYSYVEMPFLYLTDVYYQSGDIEIEASSEKAFKECFSD